MNSFKQGTFFLQEWNQCDLQRNHLFLSCFSSIQDWSSFCTKCCKGKKHFLKNNSVHGIPEMANQFLVRNITQGKHFFCFLLLNLDSIISRRTKGNNFHMLFKAKITQATIKEPAKRGKAIKSDRVIHMKSEWIRDRITLFIHTYHHWQWRSKQATTTKNPKKKSNWRYSHSFSIANSPNRQAKRQTSLSISESIFPAIQDCDLKIEKP